MSGLLAIDVIWTTVAASHTPTPGAGGLTQTWQSPTGQPGRPLTHSFRVLADLHELATPSFDVVVDLVTAMRANSRRNIDGGSPKLRRMLEGCGFSIVHVYI